MTEGVPETVAVIVNYNAGPALAASIDALVQAREDRAIHDIWVLDNASTDASFDPMRLEQVKGKWYAFGTNIGFSRAVNYAIARSNGADILLVNPDAEVVTSGLYALQRELRSRPDVAAVGGAMQTMRGEFLPSAFPEPDLAWALAHLLGAKKYAEGRQHVRRLAHLANRAAPYIETSPGAARDVDWVVGACMLIRGDAIRDVGPLDERYFLYYEEIDWCKRARAAGWKIRFVPELTARHAIGTSAETAPSLAVTARYTSMLRYFAKHHGRAPVFIIRVCGAVCAACAVVAHPRRSAKSKAALHVFTSRTTR